QGLTARLSAFLSDGPARLVGALVTPLLLLRGLRGEALQAGRADLQQRSRNSAFPIGFLACIAVLMLAALVLVFHK
ncbi:MAG: hypothetical protein AB7V57_22660, partial [Verrucomicrobiales bacterium]